MFSFFFCLLLTQVRSQEIATPSSLLRPRYFNHHAFDAEQYLKSLNLPVPTMQGPVLFPNNGPPAPRPPLVVTSRPLIESIANSNLNPLPLNNSFASPSNSLPSSPYLGRYKNYKPFYEIGAGSRNSYAKDGVDYEEQTPLPPIYGAISNHAQQKSTQVQQPRKYEIQVNDPDYTHQQSNEIYDENNSEYNHGQNYAFSYAVKDRKTGDDFSHSQKSSGSGTNGEYRVRLPDGRMQIVSYTADENGYNADVRYDEEDKTSANSIENDNRNDRNDDRYIKNDNHQNDYVDVNNNDIHNRYAKYDYTDNNYNTNSKINTDYGVNNAEQIDFKFNKESPKDYYNNYDSKEYINEDYSSEYNNNYQPYKSKFTNFLNNDKIQGNTLKNVQVTSTVTPFYSQFKDLFVTKTLDNTRQNYDNLVDFNGLSTPKFTDYEATTENIVLIGTRPSFYANLKQKIPLFSTPTIATTPRNYLVSTIASLKNRIVQPVLSARFIDKINKYLNFN